MGDGHVPGFENALQPLARRVEAEVVIQLQHLVLGDADLGSGLVVGVVPIGHNRIETVIATRQFDHDQDALRVFLAADQRLVGPGQGEPFEHGGQTRGHADSVHASAEEVAPRTR
jgi:hypothetical protein